MHNRFNFHNLSISELKKLRFAVNEHHVKNVSMRDKEIERIHAALRDIADVGRALTVWEGTSQVMTHLAMCFGHDLLDLVDYEWDATGFYGRGPVKDGLVPTYHRIPAFIMGWLTLLGDTACKIDEVRELRRIVVATKPLNSAVKALSGIDLPSVDFHAAAEHECDVLIEAMFNELLETPAPRADHDAWARRRDNTGITVSDGDDDSANVEDWDCDLPTERDPVDPESPNGDEGDAFEGQEGHA